MTDATAATLPRALFSMTETLEILGISRSTMYKLMRQGRVQPVRIGRTLRFRPDQIAALTGGV